MGNQILSSDKILRLNDFTLLGMVQSFDWSPAFNTQDVFELGRTTKVATSQELETNGSFEVASSGGTPSILARMLVSRTASGVFQGYRYNSGGAPGKNAYTFTEADLAEASFDIVCHERSNQTVYDRSVVFPRCFLTSITGRADAGGQATETFNWGGDFLVGMPDPYHDARAIPATRTTGSTATLADTGVSNATHTLLYFYVDERRIRNTSSGDAITASLGASGVVTISGLTIPATAVMRAVVYKTVPSSTFPVLADDARYTTARTMRGWQASIFIAPAVAASPTADEQWLKCQTADWNIDMRVEALRQIAYNAAGTPIYCRLPTFPFNITMNVSSYESDWFDWKQLLDPTQKPFGNTGTDPYGETYDFSIVSLKENVNIVVQYFTKAGTLLQEWRFTDMALDGRGHRIVVQGRSEINWSFRGTAFTLVGYNA
jgi:hypothetical protein